MSARPAFADTQQLLLLMLANANTKNTVDSSKLFLWGVILFVENCALRICGRIGASHIKRPDLAG